MAVRNFLKVATILILLKVNLFAQGICVPETLKVSRVSGKVMAHLKDRNEPLSGINIKIVRKDKPKKIVIETKTAEDGTFEVKKLKSGSYTLVTNYSGLENFYLDLLILSPKNEETENDIIIWLGADYLKPCSGSYAELKNKS